MIFRLLADFTLIIHLAFVLFVVLGGLLVRRRPAWACLHLPAVAWGAVVELAGWPCPLTPLENWLRVQAGDAAYTTSFVEHYLLTLIYPSALTRELQYALGAAVIAINAAIYATLLRRRRGS